MLPVRTRGKQEANCADPTLIRPGQPRAGNGSVKQTYFWNQWAALNAAQRPGSIAVWDTPVDPDGLNKSQNIASVDPRNSK